VVRRGWRGNERKRHFWGLASFWRWAGAALAGGSKMLLLSQPSSGFWSVPGTTQKPKKSSPALFSILSSDKRLKETLSKKLRKRVALNEKKILHVRNK
jgi:hypothetical protein